MNIVRIGDVSMTIAIGVFTLVFLINKIVGVLK